MVRSSTLQVCPVRFVRQSGWLIRTDERRGAAHTPRIGMAYISHHSQDISSSRAASLTFVLAALPR
jgi:hypothetical protein